MILLNLEVPLEQKLFLRSFETVPEDSVYAIGRNASDRLQPEYELAKREGAKQS